MIKTNKKIIYRNHHLVKIKMENKNFSLYNHKKIVLITLKMVLKKDQDLDQKNLIILEDLKDLDLDQKNLIILENLKDLDLDQKNLNSINLNSNKK